MTFTDTIRKKLVELPIWKSNASDNQNSDKYFVEHPVFEKITTDDSIFLIGSQKWWGKTAIRTTLKNRIKQDEIANSTVLDLKFGSLFPSTFFDSLLADQEENFRTRNQQHQELIKFTVLISILSKIIETTQISEKVFGKVDGNLQRFVAQLNSVDIPIELRKKWDFTISGEIALDFWIIQASIWSSYKSWIPDTILVNFAKLNQPIEKKLINLLNRGHRYYFLVDETDKFWSGYGDDYELFMAKFIQCAEEINRNIRDESDKKAKIVIFIRTDLSAKVFPHIKWDSGKLLRDWVIKIDWQDNYKEPSSSLDTIINERITYGLIQIWEIPPSDKSVLFEDLIKLRRTYFQKLDTEDISSIKTSALNHTFLRPRDIIVLSHSVLNSDTVEDFRRIYGKYIYTEVFKDQLGLKSKEETMPYDVFIFLKEFLKKNKNHPVFKLDDINFKDLFDLNLKKYYSSKSKFIEDLLDVSILWTVGHDQEQHFAYREGDAPPKINSDTKELKLHYWVFIACMNYNPDS